MLRGFDPVSDLILGGIPLLLGFLCGRNLEKKPFRTLLITSAVLTALLTVLYQFERTVHAFSWLGGFGGTVLTYFLFGLILGRLFKK